VKTPQGCVIFFEKKKKEKSVLARDHAAARKPKAKPNGGDEPLLRIPPSVALFVLSTV